MTDVLSALRSELELELEPSDLTRPGPTFTVTAALAAVTVAFVTAAGFALKGAGLVEMPLSRAFNEHHHGIVGAVGDALYRGIGPIPAIIGTVVITVIVLVVTRSLPRASTFAFTVAVTWLSVAVCKLLVHRSRPDAALLPHPFHPAQIDASYPSGHAAFVSALAVTAFLMARSLVPRIVAAIVGAAAIAIAGTLLAIDGVHYPTDVAASVVWVLGVAPVVHPVHATGPRQSRASPPRSSRRRTRGSHGGAGSVSAPRVEDGASARALPHETSSPSASPSRASPDSVNSSSGVRRWSSHEQIGELVAPCG